VNLDELSANRCADCGGNLKPGPRGGLGQNMGCMNCGAEFNVVRAGLYRGVAAGPVVLAHRNSAKGGPDRHRLLQVFGIELPPADEATATRERAARAYFDVGFPDRPCDHCGEVYRGPAVFCSLDCALASAE